jgi:ribosomal protein L9
MEPAVASTASSLGIKDVLVQVAVTAARNYLTKAGGAVGSGAAQVQQGATDLATQKQEAAKAGVAAAVDKAKADGQPLSEPQQTGLLGALSNLL